MTPPYSNFPIGRLELPNQKHLQDSLGEKEIGGIKYFSATQVSTWWRRVGGHKELPAPYAPQ